MWGVPITKIIAKNVEINISLGVEMRIFLRWKNAWNENCYGKCDDKCWMLKCEKNVKNENFSKNVTKIVECWYAKKFGERKCDGKCDENRWLLKCGKNVRRKMCITKYVTKMWRKLLIINAWKMFETKKCVIWDAHGCIQVCCRQATLHEYIYIYIL